MREYIESVRVIETKLQSMLDEARGAFEALISVDTKIREVEPRCNGAENQRAQADFGAFLLLAGTTPFFYDLASW